MRTARRSLWSPRVSTPAASGTLIKAVKDLQNQTNQGPCLSTARDHVTISVDDLSTDARWPLFAHRAAGMGVRSMLSFQLFVRAENLGALNLYARDPDVFGNYDEDTGLLFASHAAWPVTPRWRWSARNISRTPAGALVERDTIGQAKGIWMNGTSSTRPLRSMCWCGRRSGATGNCPISPMWSPAPVWTRPRTILTPP